MWRTQEGDDYLSANYNTGDLTTQQLAAKFGVSQSMLMRRARKLGITKSHREAQLARYARAREAKRDVVKIVQPSMPPLPAIPCLDVEPILPIVLPRVPQRAAPKLTHTYIAPGGSSPFKTCQWIETDQPASAPKCGCKALPGKSWCEQHYRRVFYSPGRRSEARAGEAA